MSRYIDEFTEDTILKVIIAYLYKEKSHREIQREILNIPAPVNGGGYITMNILHHYNIKGNKKGILAKSEIDDEINNNKGNYAKILKKVKAYINEEKIVSCKIRNQSNNRLNSKNTTEISTETKRRIGQDTLRDYILENYNHECAICNINKDDLLVCSHIVPWSIDKKNRLNPQNAICLCALHDKLFDRGYFSLSENYKLIFGRKADEHIKKMLAKSKFKMPNENYPDINLLQKHFIEQCSE